MLPKVSLIIATYNWPEALELCLKSVMKQTLMPNEIIVADDGSDMKTRQIIQKYRDFFNIPLLHIWQEDLGFRKSLILNKAVKKASSEYIIQIDGDVILDPNFITDHRSVCERDTFVRGTRAHLEEKILPDVFTKKRIHFSYLTKGIRNRFNALRIPFLAWIFTKKRLSATSVRGCNLAFWKKDFIAVNGYRNDLQGWGHEDEELAIRFVNNGIMKKKLKLKGVQYHIFHKVASRSHESFHNKILEVSALQKTLRCQNGYTEVSYRRDPIYIV